MPALIAAIAIVIGVSYWLWRARAAAAATKDIAETAGDIRLVFRRLGFRRISQKHPLDSVEDARLAASGIVIAIAKMDGDLTKAENDALLTECQIAFQVDKKQAADITAFGRWIASQSKTPEEVVRRLVKTVRARTQPDAWPQLIGMITNVATADGGVLDERQEEALSQVTRALKA